MDRPWSFFLRQARGMRPAVLVVSRCSVTKNTFRVLSIMQGWRPLFAVDCASAIELVQAHRVSVVLFDRDHEEDWKLALVACSGLPFPPCFILLSRTRDNATRCSVIQRGGFDVIGKPLQREIAAQIVDGCLSLMEEIDSTAVPRS